MKATSEYIKWLKKWIDGSLTAREEQQLDASARKDEFLQDALGGLRAYPTEDHQMRLDRLRKKINQTEERKAIIIPLYLRRIAAAVLFVVAIGTIWWVNQPTSQNEMSMDKMELDEATPAANEAIIEEAEATEDIASTDPTLSPTEPETPITEPALPSIPSPKKEVAPIERLAEAEEVEILTDGNIQEEMADYSDLEPEAELQTREITAIPEAAPSLPPAQEALPIRAISGQIVDQDGYPVAGAIISNQAGEKKAITDGLGNFQITGNDLADDSALAVRHFNYTDTVLFLSKDKPENVFLNLNRPASLAIEQRMDEYDKNQPYPLGGFEYFINKEEKSAKQNRTRRAPRTYSTLTMTTETTIAFTVFPGGRIDNFKVLETTNENRAKAAIDFLKNGPKWQLPAGIDSIRTQITIPDKR